LIIDGDIIQNLTKLLKRINAKWRKYASI